MTDTVKLEPCNCPECGGRKPCSELDTPKHKMPTHDEWAKNGTEWYISRLQWRLQKAEDLLNTRPAPTPAPDRVCICGHSKADHSEKHGMECSEECTCLKYTPAPDRDAVLEFQTSVLKETTARRDRMDAQLYPLREVARVADLVWRGAQKCETDEECYYRISPKDMEWLATALAKVTFCLPDASALASTPSHPSAGRDEVREAAQELSDRVNDYAFTPREDGGIDEESAEYEVWCACLEANKKLRQALATPQGKVSPFKSKHSADCDCMSCRPHTS